MINKLKSELVPTPLGDFQFSVTTSGSMDGSIDNIILKSKNHSPDLPASMSVEGCRLVFASIKLLKPIPQFKFSCRVITDSNLDIDPESGEGLDAKSWSDNNHMVMIGTEDEERLLNRFQKQSISLDNGFVEYSANGLSINIDNPPVNQCINLHFVISWNPLPEKIDCSCWYAVDIPHEKIEEKFR